MAREVPYIDTAVSVMKTVISLCVTYGVEHRRMP